MRRAARFWQRNVAPRYSEVPYWSVGRHEWTFSIPVHGGRVEGPDYTKSVVKTGVTVDGQVIPLAWPRPDYHVSHLNPHLTQELSASELRVVAHGHGPAHD